MNSRITDLEDRPFHVLLYSPVTPSDLSKSAEKGCRGYIIGIQIFLQMEWIEYLEEIQSGKRYRILIS